MDKWKAICSGGAWMVAAILQVIPSTWPGLLRPHPWAVGFCVIAGAIMFVYSYLGSEHKAMGDQKNVAGTDNNGPLTNADNANVSAGDQRVAGHNYGSLISAPVATITLPPLQPAPVPDPLKTPESKMKRFSQNYASREASKFYFSRPDRNSKYLPPGHLA